MKYFLLLIFVALIASCNTSQSYYKDLETGMEIRGDGLSYEQVEILVNDLPQKSTTFIFGEKVMIGFDVLEGLTRENDTTYPGVALCITTAQGDTVSINQDIVSNDTSSFSHIPLKLFTHFTAAIATAQQKDFILYINIWDKKGTGTLHFTMPFSIIENPKLKIKTKDAGYEHIYLFDAQKECAISKQAVNKKDGVALVMDGLKGFAIENELSYPSMSLHLEDQRGNVLLHSTDVLGAFKETGINAKELNERLPIPITFGEGKVQNPIKLRALLFDLKSSAQISIETEFEIR